MNILVVDDDEDLLVELEHSIADLGHQATCCTRAEEALRAIRGNDAKYHLLLTDVRMQGMDGLSLVREVRATVPTGFPVAVMSGHADLNMVIESLRLKAIDFLIKPFGLPALRELAQRMEALEKRENVPLLERVPALRMSHQLVLPTGREAAAIASAQLQALFGKYLKESERDEFKLALIEALENAVVHGNLELSSDLKDQDWGAFEQAIVDRSADDHYSRRKITIEANCDSDRLSISIEDQGQGFDHKHLPDPADPESLLRASGRGLLLIQFAMNEVSWNASGNRIEMVKYL